MNSKITYETGQTFEHKGETIKVMPYNYDHQGCSSCVFDGVDHRFTPECSARTCKDQVFHRLVDVVANKLNGVEP